MAAGITIIMLSIVAVLAIVGMFASIANRREADRRIERLTGMQAGMGVTMDEAADTIEKLKAENAGLRQKIEKKTSKWLDVRQKLEDDLKAAEAGRSKAWGDRDDLAEKVGCALRILRDGPQKGGRVS
jgi:hypothetical protein